MAMRTHPAKPSATWRDWWYAIRPHTLGASIGPILVVTGALVHDKALSAYPLILCLLVSLSAQIASNLANDLFDYLEGIDTDRRVGFEKQLSSGTITPRQMTIALMTALGVCTLSGLLLVAMTKWWTLIIGILVLLGIFAYSSGPYPLSYHGLGDISVVIFFGIIPVVVSYAVVAGSCPLYLLFIALGVGLWQTNILVVNNYRDYEEDLSTGKDTLVVLMGKRSGPFLYLLNAFSGLLAILIALCMIRLTLGCMIIGVVSLITQGIGCLSIRRLHGYQLNRLLKYTARVSLLLSLILMTILILS